MAGKQPEEDPINVLKLFTRNTLDGIFDDLRENNVLNSQELQKIGKGVNTIVKVSENLLEDFTEKTQVVGKLLKDRFRKPKNHPNLKFLDEDEDDDCEDTKEPEDMGSSSTESEDDSEESEDEEEASSENSVDPLPNASQENQASQPSDKLKLCPPDRFLTLKEKKRKKIYKVMEKEGRTRLALIICNKKFECQPYRDGCEVDLRGVQDLLESLGYSVVVEENLTAPGMEAALQRFAARPEHSHSDSTFLVFMSHGTLDGICGTKHSDKKEDILHDDTIFRIFNNRNCRSLKDKPKVIIMQACRGTGLGFVYVADAGGASACGQDQYMQLVRRTTCVIWNDAITKAHVEKDFIAFKSSTPHNVSWRLETGSVFISRLIYYVKKYSWCCHLEDIFRKVGIFMSFQYYSPEHFLGPFDHLFKEF